MSLRIAIATALALAATAAGAEPLPVDPDVTDATLAIWYDWRRASADYAGQYCRRSRGATAAK